MRPFAFIEPTSLDDVIRQLAAEPGQARLIAGGSDLLGELKDEVVGYERLISLAGIHEMRQVEEAGGGLRLGALVTVAQLEYDPHLDGPYRLLAEAARSVATPEIRAQGTLGGNLCQRPCCLYYRHALTPCLKKGGVDCPAVDSPYQAYLSIMGGQGCYSVHASDLAPPLMALDADVRIAGRGGVRTMPLERFFAGPEQDVRRENVLAADEVLTTVMLPAAHQGWRGTYLKARERTAGDFPVVSVAVGYALEAEVIRQPRVVLGGVAAVPWRSSVAEAVLEAQRPSPELAARAATTALAQAQPLAHNAFKVEVGQALVARAIMAVAALRANA